MLLLVRTYRRGAMRLVSAVVALALILAHVFGGYAHAAGHSHAKGERVCAHQHIAADPGTAQLQAHADSEHCDEPDEPATHFDAIDFVCHGGLAILVTSGLGNVDVKPVQNSAASPAIRLLLPASLERPPKSAVCT